MLFHAVYLVCGASATFGVTTAYGGGISADGRILGQNGTASGGDGWGDCIYARLSEASSGGPWNVSCALYDSSWNLYALTEYKSIDPDTSSYAWFQFNFLSRPVIENNVVYRVCVMISNPSGTLGLARTTASGSGFFYKTASSWGGTLTSLTYVDTGEASLYCSYTVNTPPSVSNESPVNGSTGVVLSPVTCVSVSDSESNTVNITWFTNESGSWVNYGNNNSVGDGTYRQTASWADTETTTYYWKVYVDDGLVNTSSWYFFTTLTSFVNSNPVISNNYPVNVSFDGWVLMGVLISINPTLSCMVNDSNGDHMNVTFRTNVSGNWTDIGWHNGTLNATVSNITSVFTSLNRTYWYSVNVTDNHNGWKNNTYCFYIINSSIFGNASGSVILYINGRSYTWLFGPMTLGFFFTPLIFFSIQKRKKARNR